jgi:membrane-associated phospholipid phosphatase
MSTSHAANTGFTALEAMGAASLMNYAVKVGTNRQYAYHPDTHGEFWKGGRSFPSGHAAASFAFASGYAYLARHVLPIRYAKASMRAICERDACIYPASK